MRVWIDTFAVHHRRNQPSLAMFHSKQEMMKGGLYSAQEDLCNVCRNCCTLGAGKFNGFQDAVRRWVER